MADDYIRRQDVLNLPQSVERNLRGEIVERSIDVKAIEALEPADVVQVRHGKWKKIGVWGRVYRCNQCGNFLDFDGVNAGRGAANFCPNCMAKMDGKKEG